MNHLHIGTLDIKKSIEFYTQFFNFKKKFDHGSGVFLENPNGFLLAIDPVSNIPQLPDWFHIGFCFSNENQVLEIYKHMTTNSVRICRDLMHEKDNFASFYVLDPDDYKIEISWHNE